ncbi:MAG: DUF927 domain-containing protein, partial [Bacilli bacterium]|nr:DUF927 domain-containing protein [Bacilli bacterium]
NKSTNIKQDNRNSQKTPPSSTKITTYKKEIDLNGEKYLIKQTLPNCSNFYFEVNKNNELEKITIKDGNIKKEVFSRVPVFIKSICVNVNNDEEKFELVYHLPRLKKWKTIMVEKTMIYDKKNIVSLSNNGLPITSLNASDWIIYFSGLEESNYANIPILEITDRLGWHKNYTQFVPYSNQVLLDTDDKLSKWSNAYSSTKSTLDEWVSKIANFRNNNIFRFILSSAFCGPLINILNQRIFIVYNYGASRSGKTACMYAATSAWGNPEELKTSFFGTTVGIERISAFQNDLLLFLDEKQVNKSQSSIEQLVYMLGNGVGKLRGNKTGGVQSQNSWKLVVLASGEETLTKSSSTTGISTRCLEIEGSPFDSNESVAESVYHIFDNCYGCAGREFIKILLAKYSDNDFKVLKEKFNEVKKKIKDNTKNDVSSYISAVSVVTLADIILSKELFHEDDAEKSYLMGLEILQQLSKKDEIDIVETCYEKVIEWIIANYDAFSKPMPDNCYYNQRTYEIENDIFESKYRPYGLYCNNTYYVFRNVLENFLESNGFSYKKMIKDFAKRNYIAPTRNEDGSIKTLTVQKKYRNVNIRMFAFPVEPAITETDFQTGVKQTLEKQKKRKIKNRYFRII